MLLFQKRLYFIHVLELAFLGKVRAYAKRAPGR